MGAVISVAGRFMPRQMFWEGNNRSSPASPLDRERVESWIRAQMALESRKVDEQAGRDSKQASVGQMSQHTGAEQELEVTNVTPFRSECGTHTVYALTCRKGDKQWRVFERYSGMRRIYDIARVSYPFVDGRRRGDTPGVCFPGRLLVNSSLGALQRAESLLLWLSTYSHVPIVADFLAGDRAISGGVVTPVHSQRSPQSRSEASTVGHQNISVHPSLNGHDDAAANGDARGTAGEDAEAGSSVSRSTLTLSALRGGSETHVSQSQSSRDEAHLSRDDSVAATRRHSADSNSPSTGSVTSGISSLGLGTSTKRARVAFLPASSPVKEMSPYSASPASARESAEPRTLGGVMSEALARLSLSSSMSASAEEHSCINTSGDSSFAAALSPDASAVCAASSHQSPAGGAAREEEGEAAGASGFRSAAVVTRSADGNKKDDSKKDDSNLSNQDPELAHRPVCLLRPLACSLARPHVGDADTYTRTHIRARRISK